jgi:hypothetical protein
MYIDREVEVEAAKRAPYSKRLRKYVESWPNTTSAWVGWSRFDIPVDRYGGVHSQLICTSINREKRYLERKCRENIGI